MSSPLNALKYHLATLLYFRSLVNKTSFLSIYLSLL